jgi:hypothetical protein
MGAVLAAEHERVILAGELVIPLVEREAAALQLEDAPVIRLQALRLADGAVVFDRAGHQFFSLTTTCRSTLPPHPR